MSKNRCYLFFTYWLLLPATLFSSPKIIIAPIDSPTITAAVSAASAGDVIFVLPGRYHESLHLNDGLKLMGARPSNTIVWWDSWNPVISPGNNTLISGLTLEQGWFGLEAWYVSNVEINGNRIIGAWAYGVYPYYASNIRILNNIISTGFQPYNTPGKAGDGIYGVDSEILVKNNIIFNSNFGICNLGSTISILYNTISNNGEIGIGMNLNENNSAQITNNIITENNKSVSPPGIFAITISGISDLLMDYNDVWQGNPKRGELYRNVTPGAHDISVNPEFIDPANMDFRLKDSSACKTASSDGSEIGAYGIGGTPGVGLKLSLVQQMEVMFRVMNYLPDTVFKRTNFKHVLMQHLEIMEEHIKQADKTNNSSGLLNSAYQIAANTIIPRIDGCEVSGFPDKDDWVTDARAEEWIYSLISNLVDTLGGSIGRSEK